MKRYMSVVLLTAGILCLFVLPAFAGPSQAISGPKFALHAKTHAAKAALICADANPNFNNIQCSNYVTNWPLDMGTDVYLVLAQGDSTGFAGATFGITYDGTPNQGVDLVGGWVFCGSGLEFPSDGWPGANTGNIITFLIPGDCQETKYGSDGVQAIVGSFYIYAYSQDRFRLIGHPKISQGNLATADCTGKSTTYPVDQYPKRLGWVGFGAPSAEPGCNPCLVECPTPTEASTWGKIKSQYMPGR